MTTSYSMLSRQQLQDQLALAEKDGDFAAQGHLLLALGDLAKAEKEYSLAQGLYAQAWSAFEQVGDPRSMAHSLRALGDVFHATYDRPNTDLMYETAIALYRQIDDVQGEAQATKGFGDTLNAFSMNTDRCMALYHKAILLFQSIGDQRREADTLKAIGERLYICALGEKSCQELKVQLIRAFSLYDSLGDQREQINILKMLGVSHTNIRQYAAAREYLEQRIALCEALDDQKELASSWALVAPVLYRVGDLPASRYAYEKALALSIALSQANQVDRLLEDIDFMEGESRPPQAKLERRVTIFRQVGSDGHLALSLMELGREIQETQGFSSAQSYFQEASDLNTRVKLRGVENIYERMLYMIPGQDLMTLAAQANENKEYALAQGLYAQARDAFDQTENREGKAQALMALGQSLINGDLNEQRTACNYFEEALTLYEQLGDVPKQAHLFVDLGYGLWRLGENERRIPLYEKALVILAQIEDPKIQSKLAIELGGSMYGHPDFAPLYEKALLMHQQAEYRLGIKSDES